MDRHQTDTIHLPTDMARIINPTTAHPVSPKWRPSTWLLYCLVSRFSTSTLLVFGWQHACNNYQYLHVFSFTAGGKKSQRSNELPGLTVWESGRFTTPCSNGDCQRQLPGLRGTWPLKWWFPVLSFANLLHYVSVFLLVDIFLKTKVKIQIWHHDLTKPTITVSIPVPSVLWRCWLGGRKGIRPVKKHEWWGNGMIICLGRDADLHMAQLMPLPLTVSCSSKIQIGFTFLVPANPGSPGKRAVKRVCVCVYTWYVPRGHFRRQRPAYVTCIQAMHCVSIGP